MRSHPTNWDADAPFQKPTCRRDAWLVIHFFQERTQSSALSSPALCSHRTDINQTNSLHLTSLIHIMNRPSSLDDSTAPFGFSALDDEMSPFASLSSSANDDTDAPMAVIEEDGAPKEETIDAENEEEEAPAEDTSKDMAVITTLVLPTICHDEFSATSSTTPVPGLWQPSRSLSSAFSSPPLNRNIQNQNQQEGSVLSAASTATNDILPSSLLMGASANSSRHHFQDMLSLPPSFPTEDKTLIPSSVSAAADLDLPTPSQAHLLLRDKIDDARSRRRATAAQRRRLLSAMRRARRLRCADLPSSSSPSTSSSHNQGLLENSGLRSLPSWSSRLDRAGEGGVSSPSSSSFPSSSHGSSREGHLMDVLQRALEVSSGKNVPSLPSLNASMMARTTTPLSSSSSSSSSYPLKFANQAA